MTWTVMCIGGYINIKISVATEGYIREKRQKIPKIWIWSQDKKTQQQQKNPNQQNKKPNQTNQTKSS